MTNLQAAVGLAQLEQLNHFISLKRRIVDFYTDQFSSIPNISLPIKETSYATNIYWVYTILLDQNIYPVASVIMDKLRKLGVGTRPFFYPLHMQPYLLNNKLVDIQSHPNAEYI